jgi:hypothetical protein
VNYRSAELGLNVDLVLAINESLVDVACSSNQIGPNDIAVIHKVAFDLARAAVDVLAFSTGYALTVVFDRFIATDGKESVFFVHDPSLPRLCTAFVQGSSDPTSSLGSITSIVFREPPLFMALDDLIGAISLHHLSLTNCARALETLRHLVAPGMPREDQWERLRDMLQIDRTYLQLITDHSKAGRHGERTYTPPNIVEEIIRRSWTIMNRFLEFRKRGNIQLPDSDFPVLVL